MRPISLLLVLLGASLAGCVGDDGNAEVADGTPDPPSAEEMEIAGPSHLVDYSRSATLVTDVMELKCELDEFSEQWFLLLESGSRVDANHTEMEFTLAVENVFSDADYTGYRIGAYYDHELVFWSDAYKESATFTHALDGSMPDLDKDQRWTFSFKRTDPLTEDDPDACTAGHGIQEDIDIQIYAR